MDANVGPQPKRICPLMSNRVLVPVSGSSVVNPNGVAVSTLLIPCHEARCAAAYVDSDGHFLGCGLAIAQEVDHLQASLARAVDQSAQAVSLGDVVRSLWAMQGTLAGLLRELIQARKGGKSK